MASERRAARWHHVTKKERRLTTVGTPGASSLCLAAFRHDVVLAEEVCASSERLNGRTSSKCEPAPAVGPRRGAPPKDARNCSRPGALGRKEGASPGRAAAASRATTSPPSLRPPGQCQ